MMAATPKKRKRPTKIRIKDYEGLQALLQFGIYHRAAIADHLLHRYSTAGRPGDKLSIGAEAFFCMIAAVEDLEMLYFAMREKAANPKRSFFAEFAGTFIKEPAERKKQKPTDKSARNMRRQLRMLSPTCFQRELGLPTFDEWLTLDRAPAASTPRKKRAQYFRELREIKRRLWQAVRNRSLSRTMSAYNKVKHGFVVLPEGADTILLVEKAISVGKNTSSVQVMPFKVTEQSVKMFVDNTKRLALTVRQLLFLYTRTEMIPPAGEPPP
jgi:hypothetical protein